MTAATEQPQTERARIVASIHALADHFAAHPEWPLPKTIIMTAERTPAEEVDEAIRVAPVLAWSSENLGRAYETTGEVSAHVTMLDETTDGVRASFVYRARLDAASVSANRYVK